VQSEEERESDVEIICLDPSFNLGLCVQSDEECESDVAIIYPARQNKKGPVSEAFQQTTTN
jgi:hypothetical protein